VGRSLNRPSTKRKKKAFRGPHRRQSGDSKKLRDRCGGGDRKTHRGEKGLKRGEPSRRQGTRGHERSHTHGSGKGGHGHRSQKNKANQKISGSGRCGGRGRGKPSWGRVFSEKGGERKILPLQPNVSNNTGGDMVFCFLKNIGISLSLRGRGPGRSQKNLGERENKVDKKKKKNKTVQGKRVRFRGTVSKTGRNQK